MSLPKCKSCFLLTKQCYPFLPLLLQSSVMECSAENQRFVVLFFFKFVFKSSYIVCDMNGYVTGEKLSRKLSLRNRLEKYMQANKERNSDPVSFLALLIYFTLYIYMYIFNQTGLINPVNLNLEYGLACRSSPASSH